MTERENIKVTVSLKGKERDIKLAETIRDAFVNEYNDERKFEALLEELGHNTVDKLIHRLNRTEKIHLYRDYNALKAVAEEVVTTSNRQIFKEACQVEDARVWINNKGKYQELVFESLYKVFRSHMKLQELIEVK